MSAVSPVILRTIKELQSLPSLSSFSLGGGTNLALQFDHRISDDIDLFCPSIIGQDGFKRIEQEITAYYGKRASRFDDPCGISDQFSFLRFFISTEEGVTIKVELLQNMKNLYPLEIIDGIRLLSRKDIGLFKLVSAANRSTKKDIYDLDFITNEIPLVELYEELKIKTLKYNSEEDRTIFEQEGYLSLIDNPQLLLKFDDVKVTDGMPAHTHDNIHINEGHKSWAISKMDWRTKMRRLYAHLDRDFPAPKGTRIR